MRWPHNWKNTDPSNKAAKECNNNIFVEAQAKTALLQTSLNLIAMKYVMFRQQVLWPENKSSSKFSLLTLLFVSKLSLLDPQRIKN